MADNHANSWLPSRARVRVRVREAGVGTMFIDVDVADGETHLLSQAFKKWDFIPLDYTDISDDASIEVCRSDDWTDIIREEHYSHMDVHGP